MYKAICPWCYENNATPETVECPSWDFSATAVHVPACPTHQAAGYTTARIPLSKISVLLEAAAKPASVGYTHPNGLVALTGAA